MLSGEKPGAPDGDCGEPPLGDLRAKGCRLDPLMKQPGHLLEVVETAGVDPRGDPRNGRAGRSLPLLGTLKHCRKNFRHSRPTITRTPTFTHLDESYAIGKTSDMEKATGWFDVGGEILLGRAQQVWKGVHASAEDWMEQLAAERGRSVATLRRWAAGRRFLETVGGQRGFPDLDRLSRLPFALVEQLVTLHRLDPAAAAERARFAAGTGTTMRRLREDAQRLAEPRKSDAERQKDEERAHLLNGLGEPTNLLAVDWPKDLAFPAPDLLLANNDRMVAVGLIGAAAEVRSKARVALAVAIAPLVDTVWLIGPAGTAFPFEVCQTLSRMAAIASGIGVATLDEAGDRGVKVLMAPRISEPHPDFRAILRPVVEAAAVRGRRSEVT